MNAILRSRKASTISPCNRNDPQLNQCIIDAVYALRPLLAAGDLGDGYYTPPLEPLVLDNIKMSHGQQFEAIFSDVKAHGGSNFTIDKLKANATGILYDVLLTLPKIKFDGKYSMKLNLLVLNLQGKGNMNGMVENAKALVKMRGTRYRKNDEEYVKFTKMPIMLNIDNIKLNLDNLFSSNNNTLNDLGNNIINENQDLYLKEIVPGLERALSEKFLAVANKILDTATYDEMFPPN